VFCEAYRIIQGFLNKFFEKMLELDSRFTTIQKILHLGFQVSSNECQRTTDHHVSTFFNLHHLKLQGVLFITIIVINKLEALALEGLKLSFLNLDL